MKRIVILFILMFLNFLLACVQNTSQKEKAIDEKNDSILRTKSAKDLRIEERRRQRIDEIRIDSLRLDSALNDALKIAKTAFEREKFTKRYELLFDDSSYVISIEILIGNLFRDNQKYFLLRRQFSGTVYLDLYKIIGDQMEKLIVREQGGMTYIGDTICDVNGDRLNDFIVHWYPNTGCCRREVYNVYLNLPDKRKFTHQYEFINPTFSVKEKTIRGVEYGHPGEVGLYKYKWNGLQVDTIEFIYPDVSLKGQFIKTKKESYRPRAKDGIVLKRVPKEYHHIESYEWFIDF